MFIFKPWGKFLAFRDRKATQDFLHDVGKSTKERLQKGINSPPKTGRKYGSHQASAPGEYPANETGRLAKSIRNRFTRNSATTGATIFYGKYLADGTKNADGSTRMAPRKMSREAMLDVLPEVRSRSRRWAVWRRM